MKTLISLLLISMIVGLYQQIKLTRAGNWNEWRKAQSQLNMGLFKHRPEGSKFLTGVRNITGRLTATTLPGLSKLIKSIPSRYEKTHDEDGKLLEQNTAAKMDAFDKEAIKTAAAIKDATKKPSWWENIKTNLKALKQLNPLKYWSIIVAIVLLPIGIVWLIIHFIKGKKKRRY